MTMSKQSAKMAMDQKSEGNHNQEKQLNQEAMAVAEMVSHLDEIKQNDKQKQEEKQKIRKQIDGSTSNKPHKLIKKMKN